jgi:hypothetical protein
LHTQVALLTNQLAEIRQLKWFAGFADRLARKTADLEIPLLGVPKNSPRLD